MLLSVVNVCLLVAVVAIGGGEAAGVTWHYSDAEHWKDDFPACGGKQQSPVNINRFYLQTSVINPIAFQNYAVLPEKQTVTNDGHTLKVEITQTSKKPYIEWSAAWFITVKYNFAQYHFHWGSKSTLGSEHTVDTVSAQNPDRLSNPDLASATATKLWGKDLLDKILENATASPIGSDRRLPLTTETVLRGSRIFVKNVFIIV